MGIRFQCNHCSKKLNVKARQAGQFCFCPGCEKEIQIPANSTDVQSQIGDAILSRPKFSSRPTIVSTTKSLQLALSSGSATQQKKMDETVTDQPAPKEPKPLLPESVASKSNNKVDSVNVASAESFQLAKPATKIEADPLNDHMNHVWHLRHKRLGEQGPLKSAEVRSLLERGKLKRGHIVWREDWNDWLPVEVVFPDRFKAVPEQGTRFGIDSTKRQKRTLKFLAISIGFIAAAFLIIAVLVYLF